MLGNLVFSLNATMPLFLVMAVGYFIRRIKVVDEPFIKKANSFNFSVTIPCLLFADMATADFRETFDLTFFLFCFIATLVIVLVTWGVCRLTFRKNRAEIAEFVQGCYRSSLAVSGMALVERISGNTSMGGIMMLATVPLYNIFAVILLQTESPDKSLNAGEHRLKKAIIGIAKNPIIISILAGFVSSLIGIKYPVVIMSTLELIKRIATPFALICIGADFEFKKAFGKIGKSGLASAFKLLIFPAITLPLAVAMGFRNEHLIAILVAFASPATPVGFIMCKQYGYEGTISSSVVALTTLLSSFTMTLFIFILKNMGYI